MLQALNRPKLLHIAAIFVGISVPSLLLGRAVIGLTLAVAFILVALAGNFKENQEYIKSLLNKRILTTLGIVIAATAVNVPFSLRPELSIEAWARSWVILGLVTYVLVAVRGHLPVILLSCAIGLPIALVADLLKLVVDFKASANKAAINSFLLILPIVLYYYYRRSIRLLFLLGGSTFFAYILAIYYHQSKASLAGLIMISFGVVILVSLQKLSRKQAFSLMALWLVVSASIMAYWLPTVMEWTSQEYSRLGVVPTWIIDLHRQLIWIFSIDLAGESPWVGFGLNASNYHPMANETIASYFGEGYQQLKNLAHIKVIPSHPHNWILEMILDAGLIGFIPVFALVVLLFWQNMKAFFRTANFKFIVLMAVNIGFWGMGLFNFSFWSTWWQASYFLCAGLALLDYLDESADEQT